MYLFVFLSSAPVDFYALFRPNHVTNSELVHRWSLTVISTNYLSLEVKIHHPPWLFFLQLNHCLQCAIIGHDCPIVCGVPSCVRILCICVHDRRATNWLRFTFYVCGVHPTQKSHNIKKSCSVVFRHGQNFRYFATFFTLIRFCCFGWVASHLLTVCSRFPGLSAK